jgi:hypothetical protein
MTVETLHTWTPDLRLPVRSTLQEFVSHDRELTLRISLRSGQEGQVEVNDRVVAETEGFPRAAALAELYTRKNEILLTDEPARFGTRATAPHYYRIRVAGHEYELCAGTDPVALVEGESPESFCPLPRSDNLPEAIEAAAAGVGKALFPAFMDQLEIWEGLGQEDANSLLAAVWASRWQVPFVSILQEKGATPLYLAVARAFDGAYFSIFERIDRHYLTEIRSHDMAEQIGSFATLEAARAHCHLFNAARHSAQWVSFSGSPSRKMASSGGVYILESDNDEFILLADIPRKHSLGRFASRRLAEAYATVHRDAMEHFAPRVD